MMQEHEHDKEFHSAAVAMTPVQLRRRFARQGGLVFACLAVLFGTVFFYSRGNDFSTVCHGDEVLKGQQLVTQNRLYLHPELLLEATDLGLKIRRQRLADDLASVRTVILTGRWVSAVFAALAVTTFALIGYGYGGFTGFWLTALSVGVCPSILLNAHFMKADTALLLGIASIFFAAFLYEQH